MSSVTISIITATFNAERSLPRLIQSLRTQTDPVFQWVVADGGSTDGTLDLLAEISDIETVVSSRSDFGIYDALNRAIRNATGEYYLVLGADDFLFPDAIKQFRTAAISCPADFITADVVLGNSVLRAREGKSWRFGLNGFVSAHSVGTIIRRSLHEKYGSYSKKFPIAADQLFVMSACGGGASRQICDFEAGEFGINGVSSVDAVGATTEFFRVQILMGKNPLTQMILMFARLSKYFLSN